jgi:MFS family permease
MTRKIFFGWWQVGACMLLQGINVGTIVLAFSILVVPIGQAFEASRTSLMLAMTVQVLISGAMAPLLGPAIDRYSLRNLALAGSALLVLGFLALSFARSITHVIAIYGLFMAPANVLLGPVVASALLSRWFVRRRGLAMGIAATGISLGGLIFPPVIQGLIDAFEWRSALRLLSVVIFCGTTPVIFFVVTNTPADRKLRPDNDLQLDSVREEAAGVQFGSTGAILKDPSFWLITIAMGVIFCGNRGVIANLAPLAIDLGTRPDRAALLVSVFSIGALTGKMMFAASADRLDPRLVMGVALFIYALGLLCFWYGAGYPILTIGALLLGLAVGGILPLQAFLLARAFGSQNIGRAMGLMIFVFAPFQLMMPLFFGWIFDETGSYDNALLLFATLSMAAILLPPLIRTQPRSAISA